MMLTQLSCYFSYSSKYTQLTNGPQQTVDVQWEDKPTHSGSGTRISLESPICLVYTVQVVELAVSNAQCYPAVIGYWRSEPIKRRG